MQGFEKKTSFTILLFTVHKRPVLEPQMEVGATSLSLYVSSDVAPSLAA